MASRGDIEAGKAFVTLYVKNSALVKGLRDAEAQLKNMGKSIVGVGATFLSAGSSIVAPMSAAVSQFTQTGTELQRMSVRTNASTEALSELGYVAEQSGGSVATIDSALSSMNATLSSAARFDAGAIQSLARLGLTLDNLRGKSPDQQFELIADSIARVRDPAERAARATAIFGGAGESLLPIMQRGAAGIRELREEAQGLGVSVGAEQAKAAAEMTAAWVATTNAAKGAALAIGGALAPAVGEALGVVRAVAGAVAKFARDNAGLVVTVAKVAAGLVVAGAAITTLGAAIWLAGAAFGGLATAATAAAGVVAAVWGVITSPAILAVGAIVALGLALAKLSGKFGDVKKTAATALDTVKGVGASVASAFAGIADDIGDTWQGIVGAVASGDLALAAEVAWAGVKSVFAQGKAAVVGLWTSAKFSFLGLWEDATTGLAILFTNAWAGISKGWTNTVAGLKQVWNSFSSTLATGFQRAQQSVGNRIIAAAEKSGAVSKEFAEAWKQSLNEPIEQDIANRKESTQKKQQEIEQQRQKDVADIERNRGGSVDTLGQMRNDADKRMAAEREAIRKQAQADIDAARAELAAAGARGKEKGEEARRKRANAPGAEGPPVDTQLMKSVAGSFSAQAIGVLGAGNSPTAKLERQAEKQLRELQKQVEAANRNAVATEKVAARLAVGK